jgi:SAM-dependent methyltransferase
MRDDNTPGCDAANLEAMGAAVQYQAAMRRLVMAALGLRAGTDVLDFGAGRGDYAVALQRDVGAAVTCLEPDRALHRAYPPGLPVIAELVDLAPRSVGRVYSLNVFEHIEDDVGALRQLAARCQPGARVFILVPANPKLWTAMDTLVGHRRRYTPRTLRAMAEAAGLTIHSEGWFDRTGYLATRAYQLLQRLAGSARPRAGEVSRAQITCFDFLFRVAEPVLDRLPFGKNCWIYAETPQAD